MNLKESLAKINKSQAAFSRDNDITTTYAYKLCKMGCVVINGDVYRPTKFKVIEDGSKSDIKKS